MSQLSTRGTRIVDITHFLTEDGELPDGPPPLRAIALRTAQLVEYGATLSALEYRGTLIPCRRRRQGKPCSGLVYVSKHADGRAIISWCRLCNAVDTVVHNWQATEWADGPMEPLQVRDDQDDPDPTGTH